MRPGLKTRSTHSKRGMGVSPMRRRGILPLRLSTGGTPVGRTPQDAARGKMPVPRVPRPRGLTLVEMMAALAIATLLAVGTLGVVRSMLRTENIARAASPWLGVDAPLRDMLRRDLAQAREYQAAAQRVTFRLVASLDPNLDQGHLPASVVYEVHRVQDRSWLVRVQRPEVQAAPSGELLAEGVARIAFEPVVTPERKEGFVNPDPGDPPEEMLRDEQSPREAPGGSSGEARREPAPPAPAVGGWVEMPDAMIVTVVFDDGRLLSFVARKGGGL